jgi:SagB-type dehydrogenase family enzyme
MASEPVLEQSPRRTAESAPRWPAGTVIRPAVDPNDRRALVVDTVGARKAMVAIDPLLTLVAAASEDGGDGAADGGADEIVRWLSDRRRPSPEEEDQLAHWWNRGWIPSLEYYLASRRIRYADVEDASGAVRRSAAVAFLREGPPPAARTVSGPRRLLAPPAPLAEESLGSLLLRRRTRRAYQRRAAAEAQLSSVLWHGLRQARRVRQLDPAGDPLLYFDSFGIGIQFYLAVYDVEGIEPGIWHYDVKDHAVTLVRPGLHRSAMTSIVLGSQAPMSAAFTVSMVADFPEYQWRYRHERGLRKLYVQVGQIGQRMIVLALGYGLGTMMTPATRDTAFLELHRLDAETAAPLYTLTMGFEPQAREP